MPRRVCKWLKIHEVSDMRGKGLWWKGFARKGGFDLGMKEQ